MDLPSPPSRNINGQGFQPVFDATTSNIVHAADSSSNWSLNTFRRLPFSLAKFFWEDGRIFDTPVNLYHRCYLNELFSRRLFIYISRVIDVKIAYCYHMTLIKETSKTIHFICKTVRNFLIWTYTNISFLILMLTRTKIVWLKGELA